jgi:hypothetical protein
MIARDGQLAHSDASQARVPTWLEGCRRVFEGPEDLEIALAEAKQLLGAGSPSETYLALVAMAALSLTDPVTPDEDLQHRLADEIPYALALACLGERWPVSQLLKSEQRVRITRAFIGAFADAIAPQSLEHLVRDPADARLRLEHYLGKRKLQDWELRRQASEYLGGRGWDQLDAGAFLAQVPAQRLRTYTDERLVSVAQNWRTWSPLVRCLKPSTPATPEAGGNVELFNRAFRRVQELLASALPGDRAIEPSDAAQQVLAAWLTCPEDEDYRYETEFPYWIAHKAAQWLRNRRPRRIRKELDDNHAAAPTPEPAQEQEQDLEWNSRQELVISFFQPKVQDRARSILDWAWENSSASARLTRNAECSDAELSRFLLKTYGAPVPPDTIATTRYRLRQRLEVLRLVRDEELAHRGPGPGVGQDGIPTGILLQEIARRRGFSKQDEPTLKNLAMLARAAAGDPSLGWVLFSRLLMDSTRFSAEAAFAKCSYMVTSASPNQTRHRMERAALWEPGSPARKRWKKPYNRVRAAGMFYLISPCWYLTVLCGDAQDRIVSRLLPSASERGGETEACIRAIVEALEKEGL